MILKNKSFLDTPVELKRVETSLLNGVKDNKLFFTGRAATSLLLAYSAIKQLRSDVKEPEVILPALSCATPSNTAIISGLKTRYADIKEESGLIDIEDIKQKCTVNTIAIVYIHLYGHTHPNDIVKLKEWCSQRRIYLIEDVAQSLGGKINDNLNTGCVGDFVVFSFNGTKIIESGGGALTVNTTELSEAIIFAGTQMSLTELSNDESQKLALKYRNLHFNLVSKKRKDEAVDIYRFFQTERGFYENLFYKENRVRPEMYYSLENLQNNLIERSQKAMMYWDALQDTKQISLLNGWENSGCCWRFSFLVNNPEKLPEFSESIRKEGFHVSNLYWPVNDFFNPEDKCPNASWMAKRIVNLWVSSEVNLEWVDKCRSSVIENINILNK